MSPKLFYLSPIRNETKLDNKKAEVVYILNGDLAEERATYVAKALLP